MSIFHSLDPEGTSIAAYLAHRTQVTPRFTTELGLRWDRQTYTNDKQVSPRLNAVWRPTDRSELTMGVGRFHQSQRIHELHVEEGEEEFGAAETAEHAEISFHYAFRAGPRIRVDAYYRKLTGLRTRYENLFEPVELFPETADDRVAISPDEARLRGLELLVRGQPDRPLFWRASYTLSSADDKIDGQYVARSWDQTHSGKFLLGFQRQDVWSASLAGTVRRGWPLTPVFAEGEKNDKGEIEYEAVPGARNSQRYADYYRLDLQARRAFPVRGGRIWLTVDLTNLTNRGNARSVNDFFFEPQADGSVDVRTEFDVWLGRTGSFSILWEFQRQHRTTP
jgi:outer membrane receptor protein involved in Fe transport